jgi:hypothetical protein
MTTTLLLSSIFLLELAGLGLADHHCEGYDHSQFADTEKKFRLCWKVDWSTEAITFKVHVDTLGWVGFGISPNGHMPGSDIVIAWVVNGSGYLQDRFAFGRTMPKIDEQQNVDLLSSSESDTATILEFRRKLRACDANDLPIEEGTSRIVWSYAYADPTSKTNVMIHDRKGSVSLNLLSGTGSVKPGKLTGSYKTFDILNRKVSVPKAETTYWCTTVKLPEFADGAHIIRYEPALQPGHELLLHHILVYGCNVESEHLNMSVDCQLVPPAIGNCRTGQPLLGWALGSEGISLPENVGMPFSGSSDMQYVMMVTHYDNPELKEGYVDQSGLRLYYTTSKRQYDAQLLEVGHHFGSNAGVVQLLLPPNMDDIVIQNICPGSCTKLGLPQGGVNVFASLLHAHSAGKRMWVKHIRNSTELNDIDRNDYYKADFQDYTLLRKEINIQPGDAIEVTCDYDTSNRSKVTVGGLGTRDEMCLAYLFVYPSPPLKRCLSLIPYEQLHDFVVNSYRNGWASNSSYSKATTREQKYLAIRQTVKEFDFSEQESRDAWREYWSSKDREFQCEGPDQVNLLVSMNKEQVWYSAINEHSCVYSPMVSVTEQHYQRSLNF